LGAGKTTFINALCKELGVTESVSSPTFSLIQEYEADKGKIIYHIDLYRIKNKEEAIETGIEDCIYSNETCFVEWPEKAPALFPNNTVYAAFEILSPQSRKLIVELPR
jgi:tRNA threonylcarbamoyladenosine biosynthesis protein TsaE